MGEFGFKIAAMMLWVSISGCMVVEEVALDAREQTNVRLSGYHQVPGSLVDIRVKDAPNGGWIRLATVRTSRLAQYDESGNPRYSWNDTVLLPDSLGLCPTDSDDGLFRAVARNERKGGSPVITRVEVLDSDPSSGRFKQISYTNLNDWPFRREYELASRMQGVTNDDEHWYFSTSKNGGRLAKVERGVDLDKPVLFVERPFPDYDHPGDMDYHDGWIWVALESYGSRAPTHGIGAIPAPFFENRRTYRSFPVTGKMPWVARDPMTGLLYSSEFEHTDRLKRYRVHYEDGDPVDLEACGEVRLSDTIDRVQGGDFSQSGRLYLATDPQTRSGIEEGAVKVVEISRSTLDARAIDCEEKPTDTAEIVDSVYLEKGAGEKCWQPKAQEIEGITIWDLDDGSAYLGRRLGQIHTILIDLDCLNRNELYLKHTRVHSGL